MVPGKQSEWWRTNDPTGRSVREFRLTRTDSERPVTGALWSPDMGTAAGPMVLFGHGASGDRYQAPICHLAARLARAGCGSLAIDGPVHGLRQVGPGGREALGDEMRRATFIDDMADDWLAALAAVREQVEVADIAYFGLSMGSIFGIPTLARLPDVKAAVLGLLGTTRAGRSFADRLLADAKAIRCPVLFLMQLEDELFPREGYLELFDALGSGDKRIHANPGLHPQVPGEEIDFAFEFLKAHLSLTASPTRNVP